MDEFERAVSYLDRAKQILNGDEGDYYAEIATLIIKQGLV
jgi:hypothetical protein